MAELCQRIVTEDQVGQTVEMLEGTLRHHAHVVSIRVQILQLAQSLGRLRSIENGLTMC